MELVNSDPVLDEVLADLVDLQANVRVNHTIIFEIAWLSLTRGSLLLRL